MPDVDAVNEAVSHLIEEVMQREWSACSGDRRTSGQARAIGKSRAQPLEPAETLLTHRDLLGHKTRILARKIIEQVVEQLKRKMQLQVEQAITLYRHSPRKVFRNLDLKTTLRRNLKNYDAESGKLLVDRLFFHAAERKKKPWHVIVVCGISPAPCSRARFSVRKSAA